MQTGKAASHKCGQILECHITCNMDTHDLSNMYAYSQLWAYISGKLLTPMLQLLHVSINQFSYNYNNINILLDV